MKRKLEPQWHIHSQRCGFDSFPWLSRCVEWLKLQYKIYLGIVDFFACGGFESQVGVDASYADPQGLPHSWTRAPRKPSLAPLDFLLWMSPVWAKGHPHRPPPTFWRRDHPSPAECPLILGGGCPTHALALPLGGKGTPHGVGIGRIASFGAVLWAAKRECHHPPTGAATLHDPITLSWDDTELSYEVR